MTSEKTLKQFILRITKIRLAVLDALSASPAALSYRVLQDASVVRVKNIITSTST